MNAESVVVDAEDVPVEPQVEEVEEQEADAPQESEAQDNADDFEVPDRFKDKSLQDVVQSYQNLEKKMQEQGQELGQLRPLKEYADTLLKQPQQEPPQVEAEDMDFFDDPDAAVRKAIESSPEIQQMREQNVQQAQQASMNKIAQAHPDYMEIVQDSKFQEWISESPVRKSLFMQANSQYNFDAGNELLSNWKDRRMIAKTKEVEQAKEQSRKEGLKAGKGFSKGSGESTAGKKIYRTADLIRLRQTDPNRYDELSDEILLAYQEGRVK